MAHKTITINVPVEVTLMNNINADEIHSEIEGTLPVFARYAYSANGSARINFKAPSRKTIRNAVKAAKTSAAIV